jgi:hypothetical protein
MNRRGVLGMLGIGAAAGPAVVSQLGSQGSTLAIPSTGGEYYDKVEAIPWNPVEQLAEAKREYELLTSDPAAWIADYVSREMSEYLDGYSSFSMDRIDADIKAMKSFSDTAKMRLHIERRAKRRHQNHKASMMSRIQQIMKEI